jgi:enoyl-CoA hydratase/carnithine racemase
MIPYFLVACRTNNNIKGVIITGNTERRGFSAGLDVENFRDNKSRIS